MNALKLLALAAFALVPVLAEAAAPPASGPIQDQAIFCEGPYALCIKAPCLPRSSMKAARPYRPCALASWSSAIRWARPRATRANRS